MRRHLRPALCALLISSAVFFGDPAFAYVRYTSTMSGKPFRWTTSCVPLTGYARGLPEMTSAEIADAIRAAAGVWTKGDPALAECTYLEIALTVAGEDQPIPRAGRDQRNNIIFRDENWCRSDSPSECYDPAALAITSLFAAEADGRILDSDIEVNAVNFRWANLDTNAMSGRQDLQNTLTHELGHFLGLDHTCYLSGPRPRQTDHRGELVPDCDDASDEIRQTTMFASADPADMEKRTLSADDQLAICEMYPVAADPKVCRAEQGPGDDGGCAIAPQGPHDVGRWTSSAALSGLGVWLTLVWVRLRRRQRRTSARLPSSR